MIATIFSSDQISCNTVPSVSRMEGLRNFGKVFHLKKHLQLRLLICISRNCNGQKKLLLAHLAATRYTNIVKVVNKIC